MSSNFPVSSHTINSELRMLVNAQQHDPFSVLGRCD